MPLLRIIAASTSVVLATAVVFATTAGASTAEADQLTAVSSPTVSAQTGEYIGKWALAGGSLEESFEEGGVVVSTGRASLRGGIAADSVSSFGYVGGYNQYAQLSGQAGDAVTSVRVVSASGVVTTADLADGIWGAVWLAGADPDEYGEATIEFDTADGTKTASTDDVDVIAADQRAEDANS
jgi:hypothetical protein